MIPTSCISHAVLRMADSDTFAREALSRETLASMIGKYHLYADQREQIEVIDGASLPMSPIYPNHDVIAILGLSLGLLSDGILACVRRPPSHDIPLNIGAR